MSTWSKEQLEILLNMEEPKKWLAQRDEAGLGIGRRKIYICNECDDIVTTADDSQLLQLLAIWVKEPGRRINDKISTHHIQLRISVSPLDGSQKIICPGSQAVGFLIQENEDYNSIFKALQGHQLVTENGRWRLVK